MTAAAAGSDDERTSLGQFLDDQRSIVLRKAAGLDRDQLSRTTAASDLTLAGLLKHLALVEDHWFRVMLHGADAASWWRDVDFDADPDWEFRTARDDDPALLIARYRDACAASRRAVAEVPSLDQRSARPRASTGRPVTLRWILLHMLAETARHNGHADLLREAIDGATGD